MAATACGTIGAQLRRPLDRAVAFLRAWDRFGRNRLARVGLGFLVILGLAALLRAGGRAL